MTLCLFQANFCFSNDAYLTMEAYLNQARTDNNFVSPSPDALDRMEKLFYRLLKGERGNPIVQDWKALHFSMEDIRCADKTYVLLIEEAPHRTGRGMYLFPQVPQGNQVLMIPHGLHDYYTSDIGIQLTLEGNFAATVFNSVHRYGNRKKKSQKAKGQGADEEPTAGMEKTWDMAALPDTCFTAFTQAFIRAFPRGTLLQLHGFSSKKRKTRKGRESDLIISAGTRKTTYQASRLQACLKQKIPGKIRLYPDDVQELGGTRNIIGAILRASDHKGFIHIEINSSMRKKIKNNPEIRGWFLNCITAL